ncbi:hypothetical protein O6H91_08G110400 [Diphasiastrum complanatum]|uniref:Uncharacterized protein n=1 Tax=Diphasiastrum complanatum TaxID=34168 RepID=A0ACC2D0Z5_DIPCM|nr:hypothetical protein O6H91_08G110400 [Diphasiastrum complanatum]
MAMVMADERCVEEPEADAGGGEAPQAAIAYHCQDFEWDSLRQQIESSDAYLRLKTDLCRKRDVTEETNAAQTAWDQFHQRHSKGLFFKERRYLLKEFPELNNQVKSLKVLEVGCGNGSTIIPILKANKAAIVYACDLSDDALKAALERIDDAGICTSGNAQLRVFRCDLSIQELPSWLCCASCRTPFVPFPCQEEASFAVATHKDNLPQIICDNLGKESDVLQDFPQNPVGSWNVDSTENPLSFRNSNSSTHNVAVPAEDSKGYSKETTFEEDLAVGCLSLSGEPATIACCAGGVDIVTMIFTLSAVPSAKMLNVLRESFAVLRSGGSLLFRDYGLYDMTMFRFPPSQQVADRLYRRPDGTLAYYFSCEEVGKLFTGVGFIEEDVRFCCVNLLNRKRNLHMKRVWVHGRFVKP